jgi:hypothetical protein
MSIVCEFAKKNGISVSAVVSSPHFDNKKNRVVKGDAVPHSGWKSKGRFEPSKANKDINGSFATMWFMDLKKAGFYVIDIDVKGDRTAKDVVIAAAWEALNKTCEYVVQTGSGGAHFYFKLPPIEDGFKVQQSIDDQRQDFLLDEENASVDYITDQIIIEGSSYEFNGKVYKYTALSGSINAIAYNDEVWNLVSPSILIAPQKKKSYTESIHVVEKNILEKLVMNITNDENTDWKMWYSVAQALFNEGGSEELFLTWSALSPKHDEKQAIKEWKSLKKGEGLTAGSLYYWSSLNAEKHEEIILKYLPPDNYNRQKLLFEKTHFKLMSPPCYVCCTGANIEMLNETGLAIRYANLFFVNKNAPKTVNADGGEEQARSRLINAWKSDPYMRTYDKLVFKPKQSVPSNHYNIFTDFPCKAVEGDFSVMTELMFLLCGEDHAVFEYVENYFAHMIQQPFDKAGVALVFYSQKQGSGKDTTLNQIGKMLGNESFFNTHDADNDVFGRFTEHLQRTILLKMEEAKFETNKKHESALLSMITANTRSYEAKGKPPIVLDDYKRYVMTTNNSNPVSVPDSDRRFVIINSSEKRVGDRPFWGDTYKALEKPETIEAYYYHLLHKDISKFNVRGDRPITNLYKEVKITQRPYHAAYFQTYLAANGETIKGEIVPKSDELTSTAWLEMINEKTKFPVSAQKFGRDMREYPEDCITKTKGKFSNSYVLHTVKLHEYLVAKGWWAE